jgi:hypothetical protein
MAKFTKSDISTTFLAITTATNRFFCKTNCSKMSNQIGILFGIWYIRHGAISDLQAEPTPIFAFDPPAACSAISFFSSKRRPHVSD